MKANIKNKFIPNVFLAYRWKKIKGQKILKAIYGILNSPKITKEKTKKVRSK